MDNLALTSLLLVLSIRTKTTLEELPDLISRSYYKIMDYLKELEEETVLIVFFLKLKEGKSELRYSKVNSFFTEVR